MWWKVGQDIDKGIQFHIKASKFYSDHCATFAAGIMFEKDKGQHILKNPLIINSMVEKVSKYAVCTGLNTT